MTYPPLPCSNRNGTCCSLWQLCGSKVAENTDTVSNELIVLRWLLFVSPLCSLTWIPFYQGQRSISYICSWRNHLNWVAYNAITTNKQVPRRFMENTLASAASSRSTKNRQAADGTKFFVMILSLSMKGTGSASFT